MDDKDLVDIINNDDLGLLDLEKKFISPTSDDRLLMSFLEVNEFYTVNKREPKSGGDIHEHVLASRLKSFRENKIQKNFLIEYDTNGLLTTEPKKMETVVDIFDDDDMGLLGIEDNSIFTLKNVPEIQQDRSDPDFVAKREVCKDFEKYEYLFDDCQRELKAGSKRLSTFVESEMKQGDFYLLSGVLIYLESIFDPYRGNSEKINRRTRCIYENGTESNILLRSLGKRLSEIGFSIKDSNEKPNVTIEEGDNQTGYIYVLRSLATDPKINTINNLYKIGFSTTSVEKRIINAEQDPTYLMAPVAIIATYRCFNMNPQKLERLLHRFFADQCLDVEIIDKTGNKHIPREWFIAPFNIIERVIDLIICGEIINYQYDNISGQIVKKDNTLFPSK